MLSIKILALCLALLVGFNTFSLNTFKQLPDTLMEYFYDDSYIKSALDVKYPYLKLENGSYLGPREYFKFEKVIRPDREYLESVNIENYIFNELKNVEITSSIAASDHWHYSDEDEMLNSSWPPADESKCLQDLSYIENELQVAKYNNNDTIDSAKYDHLFNKGYKNIQLLRYIDSWGRPISETQFGSSYWSGSYRGCLYTKLPVYRNFSTILSLIKRNNTHAVDKLNNNNQVISFRYCWAKLKAKSWPEIDEMKPPISIRSGICLPNTCDTRIANQQKQRILNLMKFNFSPLHRQRFDQIIDIYCLPTSSGANNQLQPSNKNYNVNQVSSTIYKVVIQLWLFFIFVTSLITCLTDNRYLPSILTKLTIQESWKRFVSDDEPPATSGTTKNRIDFRPLGLLRFIASFAIAAGHVMCTLGWIRNSSTFQTLFSFEPTYVWSVGLFKLVDLFILISGLLTSYTIIRKLPQNKISKLLDPKVYLFTIISKYLRWSPMFMITVSFMKAIYPSVAKGPYWDYGTDKFSLQYRCRQTSWWKILAFPILFETNGNSYMNECMPVSWHLISDLRLSIITPLALYFMLSYRSRLKIPITLGLVIFSTLWHYMHLTMQKLIYYKQLFTYGPIHGSNMLNIIFGEPAYFSAITRLHGYAWGLLAGIYLHQYQEKKIDHNNKVKKPFWMSNWLLYLAIFWHVFQTIERISSQFVYYYYGIIPPEEIIKLALTLDPRMDSISFAIITMRLVTDFAPSVMSNTKPLYKLGKLSYCVFLIHSSIIGYAIAAQDFYRMDSHRFDFYYLLFFTLSSSFIISFPLHLLFEVPLGILTSWCMEKVSSGERVKFVKTNGLAGESGILSVSTTSKKPTTAVVTRASEKKQRLELTRPNKQD